MDRGRDAALGAFLGLCVGDACGAVLEFPCRDSFPPEKVEWALTYPGDRRTRPGQITDDGEMAICLARALGEVASSSRELPSDSIARNYVQWMKSNPVDMGNTCAVACSGGEQALSEGRSPAQAMEASASRMISSQANGALMRIAPLAIFAHGMDATDLAKLARQESRLSHMNQVCQDCNAAYCIAMASLIHQPGDAQAAINAAVAWTRSSGHETVKEWLHTALSSQPLQADSWAAKGTQGWVQWAFVWTFRHLHLGSSFLLALKDTLSIGGDTDTNAAIVCAMMGALHGASGIPQALKDPVLANDEHSAGRPSFLVLSQVPGLADRLYDAAKGRG